MMSKVVAAGREQQGDMLAKKNGETLPGVVVLLTCCWSVSSSVPHHMHQEAEGKRAQRGCKTTLHYRVKTQRMWAWDRLSMGMVAVGAMAGAVLVPRASLVLGKSRTQAPTCPSVGFPARIAQSLASSQCEKFS